MSETIEQARFGELLRKMRAARGWSRAEAAEFLKVPARTLEMWELGRMPNKTLRVRIEAEARRRMPKKNTENPVDEITRGA
jgi:transcriptional regulator with XRE-family HTH domain